MYVYLVTYPAIAVVLDIQPGRVGPRTAPSLLILGPRTKPPLAAGGATGHLDRGGRLSREVGVHAALGGRRHLGHERLVLGRKLGIAQTRRATGAAIAHIRSRRLGARRDRGRVPVSGRLGSGRNAGGSQASPGGRGCWLAAICWLHCALEEGRARHRTSVTSLSVTVCLFVVACGRSSWLHSF